jgi:hypothetical protein
VAKGYKDPMTNKDINFNYLPLYADATVGVEPHTVQIYSLKDPAPTYNNKDFTGMYRFIKMAASGLVDGKKREVLFYPETAYWVSYDVDVPLFLPVYPYRRVEDLRLIAKDEISGDMKRTNSRINGQIFFASGWEWGYWFNDVITAEAAWNPHVEAATSSLAFQKIIAEVLRLDETTNELASLLGSIAEHQHELLVEGKVNSRDPSKIEKRTGIAYLAGVESFDEIPMWTREYLPRFLSKSMPLTQPNKFREDWAFKGNAWYLGERKYNTELRPLLLSMSSVLQSDADKMRGLAASRISDSLNFAVQEFVDGTQMTAYRAQFVFNLYEARLEKAKALKAGSKAVPSYATFDSILKEAKAIAERRKSLSPMKSNHKALITGWNTASVINPTVYHFGYVWSAYNLYYWKREFNKLKGKNGDNETCYMNIVKPSEVVGKTSGPVVDLENFVNKHNIMRSCTVVPESEPDVDQGW